MKSFRKKAWMTIALLIVACVTINIYFPAEKVESVAGEIVGDIRGNKSEDNQKSEDKDKSQEKEKTSLTPETFWGLWDGVAWADEVTAVSNPTIRALKETMKSRYPQLKPYYQKGVLKEGDDGYVSIQNPEGLNLRERRDLNTLVEAENGDRNRLYAEVAKALDIESSQTNRIAEIFAKEWQKSVR